MPLKVGDNLPGFGGATHWLNSTVDDDSLSGRPVLVHFWAMSCPICKSSMQDVARIKSEFSSRGLVVIGVHAPRMPSDTDLIEIVRTANELGLTEPCAVDNYHTLADRFAIQGMWPYYFFFKADGRMKRRGAGEFGIRMI